MTEQDIAKAVKGKLSAADDRPIASIMRILRAYAQVVVEATTAGDKLVSLPRVGNFRIHTRNQTKFTNPATGGAITCPKKTKLVFRMFPDVLKGRF